MHLVAPPGSGKTVVGLEVMLRINKPSIIFVPTNSIQYQWVERFCDLFLNNKNVPEWISLDIKNPQFLTISTYQGLHSAVTKNKEEIIFKLKQKNINVFVFDEAHHLKNAWWNSLMEIKKIIQPTVIGLTATPPYDVSFKEWNKYEELNGKIDEIISVPELVKEENLCPHQDFVYFSLPTELEFRAIKKNKEKIKKLFEDIQEDINFILAIENHPFFHKPKEILTQVYDNLEAYTSILIFLKHIGLEITKEQLEILGNEKIQLPKLDYNWMQVLLNFYLFDDKIHFLKHEIHQEKLIIKLKRAGVLNQKNIQFSNNKKINKSLSSSISKLKSIGKIVEFEYSNLQHKLRLVILSDYIRKEFLEDKKHNLIELNKLGVVPIFEYLRRNNNKNIKLGVLTGSLVIIPKSALTIFKEIMSAKGIDNVLIKELKYDRNYVQVQYNEQSRKLIVFVITEMFQDGYIEVLTGTKALLGEGWDAPSINTLILASFVGSYVSSNQMRGRAIRTELFNKNKTSNIWHLVCIDPNSENGGNDNELLTRRFKAFVGIHRTENNSIENGLSRLNINENLNFKEIEIENNKMLISAAKRTTLKSRWEKSINSGKSLIEEYKIPFPKENHEKEDFDFYGNKSLYYNKTIKNSLVALGIGVLTFGYETILIEIAQKIITTNWVSYGITLFGLIGIIKFSLNAFKTLGIYLSYRDISKDIENISKALLNTLIYIDAIQENDSLKVIINIDKKGAIFCHLEGSSNFEKTIFIKSLDEIINPIENPKYIIIRKDEINKLVKKLDYHSVPEQIAKKKEYALYFEKQWDLNVGDCNLVYTKSIEGRKILLKSRLKSLASKLQKNKPEKVYSWK